MREHKAHLQNVELGTYFKAGIETQIMNVVKTYAGCPSELRDALMRKPRPARLEFFINNLAKELSHAQGHQMLKGKKAFKRSTIESTVEDFTKTFIHNCIAEAEKRYQSDIKRLEAERAIQEQKDLDATVDGKPSGIFEEAGLILDEKVGPRT